MKQHERYFSNLRLKVWSVETQQNLAERDRPLDGSIMHDNYGLPLKASSLSMFKIREMTDIKFVQRSI